MVVMVMVVVVVVVIEVFLVLVAFYARIVVAVARTVAATFAVICS